MLTRMKIMTWVCQQEAAMGNIEKHGLGALMRGEGSEDGHVNERHDR